MRLPIISLGLLPLSLVSAVALPTPQPASDLLSFEERDLEFSETGNALMVRDDDKCQEWHGRVVESLISSKQILAYFTTGAAGTLSVCRRLGGTNCATDAVAVGAGFVSIYYITGNIATARGVNLMPTRDLHGNVTSNATIPLHEHLTNAFNDAGESFDSIHDISHTLPSREGGRQAIRVNNHYFNGSLVNYDIHHFSNGSGHALVGSNAHGNSSNAINKRDSGTGPGFKISYTTRQDSGLSPTQKQTMAKALANDWAKQARSHPSMESYIGLMETDSKADVYFRVIPETKNFGLNYESVNVCGGLAGFL